MKIYTVDAFTNQAFTGNPAAVCLLEGQVEELWMQQVALEMNLAETAFLRRTEANTYDLRWFTPEVEVDLCGHATLASAHILWETGSVKRSEQLKFHTRSGLLTAKWKNDWIELDFPALPIESCLTPELLSKAIGAPMQYVGQSRFDYIVELPNEEAVRSFKPDFELLRQLDARGVIVTSRSDEAEIDFVSRCFYPAVGINEDPVTGSAHCCLGPYWQQKLNKDGFIAKQVSARGGTLHVEVAGDRVLLAGQAVTVMAGELL